MRLAGSLHLRPHLQSVLRALESARPALPAASGRFDRGRFSVCLRRPRPPGRLPERVRRLRQGLRRCRLVPRAPARHAGDLRQRTDRHCLRIAGSTVRSVRHAAVPKCRTSTRRWGATEPCSCSAATIFWSKHPIVAPRVAWRPAASLRADSSGVRTGRTERAHPPREPRPARATARGESEKAQGRARESGPE